MTLPDNWPRDMAGLAKAPRRPIMDHLDVNGRLRELERWIDMIPEPPGGWSGRDLIAYRAICAMVRMFAPVRDMGSSAWWCIDDAMAALVQIVEAHQQEQASVPAWEPPAVPVVEGEVTG